MATMRDVAHRAGVSAKTVSRVINNDRYVSADVRERVERAIDELQYVPNMLAVTFRAGTRRRDRRRGARCRRSLLRQHHRRRRTRGQQTRCRHDPDQRRLGAVTRTAFPRSGVEAPSGRNDHLPGRPRHVLPAAVAGAHTAGVRRPRTGPTDRGCGGAGRRRRRARRNPSPHLARAPQHRVLRRRHVHRIAAPQGLAAGTRRGRPATRPCPHRSARRRHADGGAAAGCSTPPTRRARSFSSNARFTIATDLGAAGVAPQRHRAARVRRLPHRGGSEARDHGDPSGR